MDNQDALRQATLIFQGLGCPLPWFWEGADRSNEDPLIFWGCKHASGPDWDCSEEKTGEKNFPKTTQKWLLRGHGTEKPLPLSTVTARVDGGLPQFYIVKSFIHKLRGQSLECFLAALKFWGELLTWCLLTSPTVCLECVECAVLHMTQGARYHAGERTLSSSWFWEPLLVIFKTIKLGDFSQYTVSFLGGL